MMLWEREISAFLNKDTVQLIYIGKNQEQMGVLFLKYFTTSFLQRDL